MGPTLRFFSLQNSRLWQWRPGTPKSGKFTPSPCSVTTQDNDPGNRRLRTLCRYEAGDLWGRCRLVCGKPRFRSGFVGCSAIMNTVTLDRSLDPVLRGVGGTRVCWEQAPPVVRASIEDRLRAKVLSALSQESGFSPALAARLTLDDGRRIFVKAIGPDEKSGAPGGQESYRREARISAALPPDVAAPRLTDTWEGEGWVVLVLEDLDGANPDLPWRDDQLDRVLQALTTTAAALTPSPIAAPPGGTPGGTDHWRILAEHRLQLTRFPEMDRWVLDHLDLLVQLEESSRAAASGNTLVHSDLRADNIVLTDERVFFVDWPHARIAAPWLDLVWFLPSVAMQGGPSPNRLFWKHPLAQNANHDQVTAALAAFAGFMLHGAAQLPPPGLPTLRSFQLAQGQQAVQWLQQMTGAE